MQGYATELPLAKGCQPETIIVVRSREAGMERLGTLETICRYPVKSMGGEEVEEAFVGYSGLMGDRVYAFVRTDRPKGFPWHTGREQEDLLLFHPHFRQTEAVT